METWLWGRAEGATGSSGSRVAGSTSQLLSLPGNSVLRREPTALRKLTVQKVNQGSLESMQKLADLRAWEVLGISSGSLQASKGTREGLRRSELRKGPQRELSCVKWLEVGGPAWCPQHGEGQHPLGSLWCSP